MRREAKGFGLVPWAATERKAKQSVHKDKDKPKATQWQS